MRPFVSALHTDILGQQVEGEDENICERFTYRHIGAKGGGRG